ncbi:XRE family transcriptional regulator [Campylobacter jejuni]
MTNNDFESILKKCNLSKKEFATLCDLPYPTLMNWVKSWLENYIKAQKYNKIKDLIKDDL